ncbi:hypothetical protein B0H13DRAFT_1868916 [Mycena leptocephala]|nr:hypothetical protein B0H13DRAFT_1868916 [Mycena leptocephala]
MFSFTSLLALALAVTGAIARPPSVTTWSEAITAVDEPSLPCLGAGVSASQIATVKAALASGKFATVPCLTLADSGATMSYQNLEVSSTVFTSVAVSDATDNIEAASSD